MIASSLAIANTTKAPWVYFDLGNTIIDTRVANEFKYFKGSKEYIEELRQRGLKIGLITNIPEKFGPDYNSKLETLKKYIEDGWVGETPFDWDQFDQILLPLNDGERKPKIDLFQRAIIDSDHCPLGYISEDQAEVKTSYDLGFASFLIKDIDASSRYIPLESVVQFLRNSFQLPYDRDCFNPLNSPHKK